MEKLKEQLAFVLEIDRLKQIYRQSYLVDGTRKENDAEHSWHIACMALVLREYAPDVDLLRVISMLLVHDLIEIDAGDTYAYDEEAAKSKREREVAAAERIFGLLPEGQGKEFRELWDEFEEKQTKEAEFAHVMDRIQPFLLNHASGGKSWKEHGVKKSQIYGRNAWMEGKYDEIWEYMKELIDEHVAKGNLIDA
jgi:putative hydrolase of HD superfamily